MREVGGFLKNVCHRGKQPGYFKCAHSKVYFSTKIKTIYGQEYVEFSDICEEDPKYYQTCGLMGRRDISHGNDTLCGDFVCKRASSGTNYNVASRFIEMVTTADFCDGKYDCENTDLDEQNCAESSDTEQLPYSGKIVKKSQICNGICDIVNQRVNGNQPNCEDEIMCNGYMYGKWCHLDRNDNLGYMTPHDLCDDFKGWNSCSEFESDEYCRNKTSSWCPHHSTMLPVPIYNYTRCAALSIERKAFCADFMDQTNCTDPSRVALQCRIRGFLSSVSKLAICAGTKLCDDGLENICLSLSQSCRVHKHKICDLVADCKNGEDESSLFCDKLLEKKCVRRYGNGTALRIPHSWIYDETEDCIDGIDEREIWPKCGQGKTFRHVIKNETCENVFICRQGGFIEYDELCDGRETCGNENSVCKASRKLPDIPTKISLLKNPLEKFVPPCVKGLSTHMNCTVVEFMYPDHQFFGVSKKTRIVTSERMNPRCNDLFGEHYLFSSCTGKCPNASCPLKNVPRYENCPSKYKNRVGTLANNDYLTFFEESRGVYHNQFFVCDDTVECVEYSQVCDLVDDCGDGSDERDCTNNFQCTSSGLFIPKISHCDGKFDCLDLSDECNIKCNKQILDGSFLKWSSRLIGALAVVANFAVSMKNLLKLKETRTSVGLANRALVTLIGFGDFMIGIYMLAVSVIDSFVYADKYCSQQQQWLTTNWCAALGVISTIGCQISLISMTVLSVIRARGILQSMKIPEPVTRKSILISVFIIICVMMSSFVIAVFPLLHSMEDFFVNGMSFDKKLRIFIGLPDKMKLMKILEQYYGRIRKIRILSWRKIIKLSAEMFSHDKNAEDLFQTTRKVHFYGNDGVCLFKYFVSKEDPQKLFVWTVLAFNFLCFVLIFFSYVLITIQSKMSSKASGSKSNKKRDQKLQMKVTLIITTDFISWIPFIITCVFHYFNVIDATPWYSIFSMIILPINSVINPLLYNSIPSKMKSLFRSLKTTSLSNLRYFQPSTFSRNQSDKQIGSSKGNRKSKGKERINMRTRSNSPASKNVVKESTVVTDSRV